jgi:5'-3' exonuclease
VTQLTVVAKGKVITEGEKESWDSNAITPGTSLVDLWRPRYSIRSWGGGR